MTTGIYKITNLVNGKVYIGASKNIEKRWREHRSGHTTIAEYIQTFGLDNFKFEVLLECPEDMLCQWERDMICLYDSDDPEKGYNDKDAKPYSLKASEALKGRKLSDETKRKLSEANKGKYLSDETKRKISEAKKNIAAETRRKLSEAFKGRKLSDETKRKLSEAIKRRWSEKKRKITKQKETNIC